MARSRSRAGDQAAIVEVVDHGQPRLDGVDGSLCMAPLDVGQLVVREADRADETSVREFRHRAPGLLERDASAVGIVQEVDVDLLSPEPAKTGPARSMDLFGAKPRSAARQSGRGRGLRRDQKLPMGQPECVPDQ